MSDTTLVDDQSPLVVYSSGWTKAGGPNEFDSTTSRTSIVGQTATLRFSGTGIGVFGTIASIGTDGSPVSSYSVDGGPATFYTGVQMPSTQYKVQFFQSGPLASGEHTLVLTCTSPEGRIYLDFFEITDAGSTTSSSSTAPAVAQTSSASSSSSLSSTSPPPPSAGASSSTLSSRVSSFSSITSTPSLASIPGETPTTVTITSSGGLATSSLSFTSSAANHNVSGTTIGAIIGGVLGGLLVLLVLLLVFRQRRRHAASYQAVLQPQAPTSGALLPTSWSSPNRMSQITPFDLTQLPASSPPNSPPSSASLAPTIKPNTTLVSDDLSLHVYPPSLLHDSMAEKGPLANDMQGDSASSALASHPDLPYDPPPTYNDIR